MGEGFGFLVATRCGIADAVPLLPFHGSIRQFMNSSAQCRWKKKYPGPTRML